MTDVFTRVKSPDITIRRTAETELITLLSHDLSLIKNVLEEIRTGDITSRWYLARALTKTGTNTIPILSSHAETETDPTVQKYIGAIFASYNETAIDALISLFSSPNPLARGMAASALERIGQPAVPALLLAAKSENQTVRICAGLVLQKGGIFNY